ELERLGRRQDVRPGRPRPREETDGSERPQEVEGVPRRRAVGTHADVHTGRTELGQRRDAAAERSVRPGTVGDARAGRCQEADLVILEDDAVRRNEVWSE